MKAKTLLKPGETALVVFTKGPRFEFRSNGSGETGNWKIDPRRSFSKVIIYRRRPEQRGNEIYIADYVGMSLSDERGRYRVHFVNGRLVNETKSNWIDFAEGSSNPVRYIRT